MAKAKTRTIKLTKNDIDEILDIIDVCQSHLKDYDIEIPYDEETGEGCVYYDTNSACDKWDDIFRKLLKKKS